MKTIVPAYYPTFRCIADRCRHSCCIGWEIDIDDDTAAKYRTVGGELGERLKAAIVCNEDGCSFRLDEQERCPFLNTSGLCDIITELGEDALCQICTDHPRFRNHFSDRTEIGLGLCCEEATRLILTSESDKLTVLDDDGDNALLWDDEQALLSARDEVFTIAHDRSQSIHAREQAILRFAERQSLDGEQLYSLLSPLERLEDDWSGTLALLLTAPDEEPPQELAIAFERLLVYFLYRHLPDALDDDRLAQRIAFAAHSVKALRLLCAASGNTLDALLDLARRYSSEIEYSQENIDALLDAF